MHPRLFCAHEHRALPDVPSQPLMCPEHTFGSRGWGAMREEFLREGSKRKPTDSSGGCGSFTIAEEPEHFVSCFTCRIVNLILY